MYRRCICSDSLKKQLVKTVSGKKKTVFSIRINLIVIPFRNLSQLSNVFMKSMRLLIYDTIPYIHVQFH